jgi:hypothetical protein
MGVAGKMSELPLPELLTMLGGRRGKLRIQQIPNIALLEVHIDTSVITACVLDGRFLRKESQALDRLVAATASPSGLFHFLAAPASELAHRLHLPIQKAAIEVAQRVDEILGAKDEFPPDEQILRWAGKSVDSHLDDPGLEEFVAEADDALRYGVSPQRLAAIVQLSTPQVQYYLLTLARLGWIDAPGCGQLWSKLDSSLRTKSSPFRLAREAQATPEPASSAEPRRDAAWRSGRANKGAQKVVPNLTGRRDDQGVPREGKITRLIG